LALILASCRQTGMPSETPFNPQTAQELRNQLAQLTPFFSNALPWIENVDISNQLSRKICDDTQILISALEKFARELDPISEPSIIFDPSDPRRIGELIATTLLNQPRHSLAELASSKKFYGSGVYSIYYNGSYKCYQPASNTETPLYIGKVNPKDTNAQNTKQQGTKLYDRLVNDHAKNINTSDNLNLSDFDCRFLVVKSAWQNTAEDYLINWFKPIWNNEVNICFGIGKHGDASKTRANKRSPWDTLHPGRKWAWTPETKANEFSAAQISSQVLVHYSKHPPITNTSQLPTD